MIGMLDLKIPASLLPVPKDVVSEKRGDHRRSRGEGKWPHRL